MFDISKFAILMRDEKLNFKNLDFAQNLICFSSKKSEKIKNSHFCQKNEI